MKEGSRRCLCCGKGWKVWQNVVSCKRCNLCVWISGEKTEYYSIWEEHSPEEPVVVPEGCLLVWGSL